MIRICVSVEGKTEVNFIEQVLAPYFCDRNILLTASDLRGNVSVEKIQNKIKKLIYSFDYVTTLYDFYGFRRKNNSEKTELENTIINSTFNESEKRKIKPYIQMYEYESLFFSEPEKMADVIRAKDQATDVTEWATDILQEFDNNPENINDSKQTAPSKRLKKHTNYRKTTHGHIIASAIGIEKMRQMCSNFDKWITTLEKLGE